MIKAYLIDDEKKILALMERLVDWESLGIEVIGTAVSGQKGFDAILENEPDIVVTDIKMPGMDGLEMIRQVRSHGLKVHFILISGHKHFEYAQTAIQYGVENYLLKPINKQELTDNLINVRDKILEEKSIELEQISMQSKVRIASGKMRRQFLMRIMAGERMTASPEEISQEYMLNLQSGSLALLLVKPDPKKAMDKEQMTIADHKIASQFEKRLREICSEQEGMLYNGFIVFLVNYGETDLMQHLLQFLDEQVIIMEEFCDITVGISDVHSSADPAYERLYEEAMESIRRRIFEGVNRVIAYQKPAAVPVNIVTSADLDELRRILEIRDREQIHHWLDHLLAAIRGKRPDTAALSAQLDQIYELVRISFYENRNEKFRFPMEKEAFEDLINNAKSTAGIREALQVFIWCVLDAYEASLDNTEKKAIRTAKKYIADHYAENISLETIANEIFMNPTYFSILFKKEEGVNFSDYLTNFRIERAKELLKDDAYSISQVGSMVGYGNARYFSRVFQKTVGIKPSDFRKLYL